MEGTVSERVTVVRQDGIADVRLNRPDKLNGLDPAMFEALVTTGRALAGERALRAVVLSGEGRAFSAGLDFASVLGARAEGRGARDLLAREPDEIANFAQQAAWVWAELPVPVIAAVHGPCFGGGLQIALAADLRIVAPDAQLSVMEVRWGLVPDMTGTQTLRHLVRLDVLEELVLTGRIVTGPEAVALGLATRLSATPRATALELAREMAAKSPDAIRAGKRLLRSAVGVGLAEGLRLEEATQRSLLGGANQMEAVRANLARRAPRFEDPPA